MPAKRLAVVFLLSIPAAVFAGQDLGPDLSAEIGPAEPGSVPRTWLFNEDSRVPSAGRGEVFSRLTWSSQTSAANRPFAGNLGSPGAMMELGGELGLGGSFSLQAIGVQGAAYQTDKPATGAQLGFRWAPFANRWRSTRLVFGVGYLRELSGGDGAWGNVALEQDLGRARIAISARSDHVFAQGRDGVDVMVTAGAHVQLSPMLHAGVEYLAQDLEGAVEDDAEGGASHLVGAVVGIRLLKDQLSILGGPALGLGRSAARALGRVAVALAF